jgi:ATP-dependent helicase HrpB
MTLTPLPIDPYLPQILESLQKTPCLLLQAQPGTGKTTRVPRALLTSDLCQGNQEVWVLEPRRLAAKMAAARVAAEMGEIVGKTVGYQFRFESVGGPQTRLWFLTEGLFLKRLQRNPRLKNVAAVVLDEFHERHLQGDAALSVLRALQKTERADLRLVVMSATLSTEKLEAFLDSPAKLDIAAPHFPLKIQYAPPSDSQRLEAHIARTVKSVFHSTDYPGGDFLVFLPGMSEMRRAEDALRPLAKEHGMAVHLLHGELSKEEQERAVLPGKSTKIILSTNIAESSVTIEGVRVVIDSGLHRSASVSSWSGMPSLRVRPISKASATQRAGRAARTGPGLCVRLYAQGDFDHRAANDIAEIHRVDLCALLLELSTLKLLSSHAFQWFDPPTATALGNAQSLLYRLGFVDSSTQIPFQITESGERASRLPLHPRLARLLLEAEKRHCLKEGLKLATLLSEDRLETLDAFEALSGPSVNPRVLTQLQRLFPPADQSKASDKEALARSALCAFPDRVAKCRAGSREELVLSGGGSVFTSDLSYFSSAYYLILNAREVPSRTGGRGQVRATSVIPVQEGWLFDLTPSLLQTEETVTWDASKQKVIGKGRLLFDALVLEETVEPAAPNAETVEVLLRSGLKVKATDLETLSPHEWTEALTLVCAKDKLENLFAKQALVREHAPHIKLPSIAALLRSAFLGYSSLEELRELDWEEALIPSALGRHDLPQWVQLPGGRKVDVHYAVGRLPWIESRLQDFFGMKQGPSLLGGKLPLQLHLLAPNYRAVQVTTDLAGFWKNTYPEVRRELSRNYPRHSWPDDPLTATPPSPKIRK